MRMILGGTSGTKPTAHAAFHRASGNQGVTDPMNFAPRIYFPETWTKTPKLKSDLQPLVPRPCPFRPMDTRTL